MGWKESNRVSERLDFVMLASVEGANFSELCRRFEISRKTGYKWLSRWRDEGADGLVDQSRRPSNAPSRTSADVEQSVIDVRAAHPAWGGRKIRRCLQNRGLDPPAASTVTSILRRRGLIDEEEARKHRAFSRFERSKPNELWQLDYKGDFELCSGKRCYPLTLLDDHSRFALTVHACANQQRTTVQQQLKTVFRTYGIPDAIYVDNGAPWGTAYRWARHTKLTTWLMRHDIEVIHGRPHHPQGRGKIERFHRTMKLEVLQDRQFCNLKQVQATFDPWRSMYNHERPHDALGLDVPSQHYEPSERSFQEKTQPYEYSSHFITRRPNSGGQIKLHGQTYRLSEIYNDQKVGLLPTTDNGIWDVYYCRFRVGQINEETGRFSRSQTESQHHGDE